MRAKRSKSEERRRKLLYRQKRTDKKVAEDRVKDKERKRSLSKKDIRENKKYYNEWEENRKRMQNIRLNQTLEEKNVEKEKLKERMRRLRSKQSPEEKEYEQIRGKHRKRQHRQDWDEEEHMLGKQKAKTGMRLLREEGYLKVYCDRGPNRRTTKKDDLSEWDSFVNKSESHKQFLTKTNPDIITRINERKREEAEEKERKRQEKKSEEANKEKERYEQGQEGEWIYNPANDDYWWSGEGDPVYYNDDVVQELTEEEMKSIEEQAEIRWEACMKEARERRNKKDREKRKAMKEAMKKPIAALPAKELCEYEKIREENIKERYEAMKQCGFFEDLEDAKIDMVEKAT